MRISDWSSDVCSSDLRRRVQRERRQARRAVDEQRAAWRHGVEARGQYLAAGRIAGDIERRTGDVGIADRRIGAVRGGELALGRRTCHGDDPGSGVMPGKLDEQRSEEHTSELQSIMRISYA